MVRTVSHVEDEETHDSSSPIESKRVDQKFMQNSDKFILVQVIQYIQFLQEKLQTYEGSCQVESFGDQSQLDRDLSGHEDNVVLNPTVLSNAQNSVGSDLTGSALYRSTDNPPMTMKALPLNMPPQAPMFESVTAQPHPGSFPDAGQLTQQSRSHFWQGRSCGNDCSVPIYAANKEELKSESGEASISNSYSQGTTLSNLWCHNFVLNRLLNSLTNALQSSGVDLSQTSISVQLDIGKQTNGRNTNTTFNFKDPDDASGLDYGAPLNDIENYGHPRKRFRAD
ncbi:UNVERIFIED_CONTAM: Transcription factor BIM2 [Sesamum calycinum]|uniref:Transcription factor BIM2 n=1 Tax=Sesamum calycinum TaxID=2727403 RepID=A0AAW2SYK4_9LAMI